MRDEDRRYAEYARRKWTGILATNNGHYQPYAYVTNYGGKDLYDSSKPLSHTAQYYLGGMTRSAGAYGKNGWAWTVRPAHYADDSDRDILLDISLTDGLQAFGLDGTEFMRQAPVLFRKVPDLPPWVEPCRDARKVVHAYLSAGRHLQERGFIQSYGMSWSPINTTKWASKDESGNRTMADERAEREAHNDERKRRDLCASARVAVLRQVNEGGTGWLAMSMADGEVLRVPRAPFEHWALDRVGAGHLAPPWNTCSVPGLKRGMEGALGKPAGDDPLHTDWMLGAGLDPMTVKCYGAEGADENLVEAASRLMLQVQDDKLSFSCIVLAGTGSVSGNAFIASHARRARGELPEPGQVVVLPDAGAAWMDTVLAACGPDYHGRMQGGVIVAKGGAMAHLVVETRAMGTAIMLMEKATTLYKDGQLITMDCEHGKLQVHAVDLLMDSDAEALEMEPDEDEDVQDSHLPSMP